MTLNKQAYQNVAKEPNKPKFPAARYFQIHFEHLENQLDDTKRCLEALQQQVAELHIRFGSTIAEIGGSNADK
ncbi:MAG: hypothetical protein Q7U57_11355 [Methylovulum sp.]|nr:hypothetical protein [Methylovulum sp.]